MPELSDRPKLPPPLVAPPAPSLLPTFPVATAAAAVGADAAGNERLVMEGDAAVGRAALVALSGSSSTATAVQVPAFVCIKLVTEAPIAESTLIQHEAQQCV